MTSPIRLNPRALFISAGLILFLVLTYLSARLTHYDGALSFGSHPTPPARPKETIVRPKESQSRPLASRPAVQLKETFPDAVNAKSPSDLPPVPRWNAPPVPHVKEKTPMFVGFTRNWFMLQQTVVSLITAGWPPEDIYVVENTGVMDANKKGKLTPQNPFYLDHHRLTKLLGVNVLVLPSYQSFAQLQNFYMYHSIENDWPYYFWSHMDVVVQNSEEKQPYKSFYLRAVDTIRNLEGKWALKYFSYDWVTLMNTETMVELGGWDTMITYYTTDCDMYERMRMGGFSTSIADAGPVYDVGESLPDLKILYRVNDQLNSTKHEELQIKLKALTAKKNDGALGPRNRWQIEQTGGQGEPYYVDMDGWAEALENQVQAGIKTYHSKWAIEGCKLLGKGRKPEDAWMLEKVEV